MKTIYKTTTVFTNYKKKTLVRIYKILLYKSTETFPLNQLMWQSVAWPRDRGKYPHFHQDSARDSPKIDEKIDEGGGTSKSSEM